MLYSKWVSSQFLHFIVKQLALRSWCSEGRVEGQPPKEEERGSYFIYWGKAMGLRWVGLCVLSESQMASSSLSLFLVL